MEILFVLFGLSIGFMTTALFMLLVKVNRDIIAEWRVWKRPRGDSTAIYVLIALDAGAAAVVFLLLMFFIDVLGGG
jgi:hypothetical protein